MRHYLLVGEDGVGKTSFMNALAGQELLAEWDFYKDEVEPVVETRTCVTPAGALTLSIARGADPDSYPERTQANLAEKLYDQFDDSSLSGILFFIPLTSNRFYPNSGVGPTYYVRTLALLTRRFPRLLEGSLWLVHTFSAQRVATERDRVANFFANCVSQYVAARLGRDSDSARSCHPCKVLLVDNRTADWDEHCLPCWRFFTAISDEANITNETDKGAGSVDFRPVARLMAC